MSFKYANLHVHTDKSNLKLIDSINKTKTVIDYAYTLGHKGIAITDHDCLSAHVEALKHYDDNYQDKDFKLVLGNEIYLTKNDLNAENHDSYEYNHFILLAKDKIGHQQLRELSSRAWERSYNKFKIMRTPTYYNDLLEVVKENPGHLIASSACLGGYIPKAFERKDFGAIQEFVELMDLIFGEDNFFIEMQPSLQKEQIDFNKYVLENFPLEKIIITTDAHYLKKEDRAIHESFLKSKEGEREVADFYSAAYMMSVDEISEYMSTYCSGEKLSVILNNSGRILDKIETYSLKQNVSIPKVDYEYATQYIAEDKEYMELVSYHLNEENYIQKMYDRNDSGKYLVHMVFRGLFEKIDTENVDLELYIGRLNYEFEQIYKISEKIGSDLSDYFITMAKIIDVIWSDGDSLVGVSRGSGAGYLLNYLIGITQINPLIQPLEMSPWRFIHESRPELPDIDIDTESTKRKRIFNKVQEYFNSIGGDLINVCAFGTEGSKSAIKTAARGLGIDDDLATYLTSMIPNERGKDLTLSQCYYGDEDHQPIKKFVEEMNRNPELWLVSKNIEGLVTRLTVHAAGVIVLNGAAYEKNSKMKTNSGVVVTAYNLGDSEYMGGLKYDFLTVQALDKIRTCMNLLLEDGIMEWKGSLKETYNHYLLPAKLDYDNKDMWKKLCDGDIIDVFQYDTQVGSQAIKKIRPQSIVELAVANSVMRLMSSDGGELPLETYVRFKNNINLWYNEMRLHGLNNEEIAILEKYLKPLSGVADSQEAAMLLSMDPNIAGFSVKDANKLRKAIA